MNATLTRCLDDLESRIDEQQEERFQQSWRVFLDGELTDGVFTPPNRIPAPAGVEWPRAMMRLMMPSAPPIAI